MYVCLLLLISIHVHECTLSTAACVHTHDIVYWLGLVYSTSGKLSDGSIIIHMEKFIPKHQTRDKHEKVPRTQHNYDIGARTCTKVQYRYIFYACSQNYPSACSDKHNSIEQTAETPTYIFTWSSDSTVDCTRKNYTYV